MPQGAGEGRYDGPEEVRHLWPRPVVELLPEQPEALGLLALMLYAEARRSARRDAQGEYVPLAQQDPAFWNASQISEAEALLLRARTLGSIGPYQLEGALQSAHTYRCAPVTTTGPP
jgi:predicted RNA polymerase sigma factor